jgi:hypothetical protein
VRVRPALSTEPPAALLRCRLACHDCHSPAMRSGRLSGVSSKVFKDVSVSHQCPPASPVAIVSAGCNCLAPAAEAETVNFVSCASALAAVAGTTLRGPDEVLAAMLLGGGGAAKRELLVLLRTALRFSCTESSWCESRNSSEVMSRRRFVLEASSPTGRWIWLMAESCTCPNQRSWPLVVADGCLEMHQCGMVLPELAGAGAHQTGATS